MSHSGFYAWQSRPESERARENKLLLTEIERIYERHRQVYGSPRIHAELKDEGYEVGHNRIARLMQVAGIQAKRRRPFRKTTDSDHRFPVAPNLLNRQFDVDQPNRVWASDITYIATQQGWLFLAVVLDLYSRRVVGWALSNRIDSQLTRSALTMAVGRRQPGKGLLHHSDRGLQYATPPYQKLLERHGMISSMSRTGNCWDNAVVESFFSSLELELLDHREFKTRDEARTAVFDYIEAFYNRERRHSYLGYRSPADYEAQEAA
ncbi:MAG: IS3 family transposase [Deltaproteobacteria bacterium]|nr:MAG: IS3 family transposase [Deltaproteobacteria bacterium]